MANEDIRREIRRAGIKLWQVAYMLGIQDSTFSRKLRRELPVAVKTKIKDIIIDLSNKDSL